jgi:Flp pilus assembly protein TadG
MLYNIRARLARLKAFRRSTSANVAMIFALSLIPITVAAGAGLDLARAMYVRYRLTEALDAAGLAVGGTTGFTQAQMQNMATQYFNANYVTSAGFGTPSGVNVAFSGQTITLSANVPVPTTLMKIAGFQIMNVQASSTIVWGQTKLWVSLVLDNTGSMTQTDNTGTSKISALKTATSQLLTTLKNAAVTQGDVQVAIVPFSKDVNTGVINMGSTWVDWTDWDSSPPNSKPSTSIGPGSACPYGTAKSPYGYACTVNPTNGSSTTTTIPSSGTYKGYVCPGVDNGNYNSGRLGHYWNGCWNTTGSAGSYVHTWIPNAHTTWTGCVMDRGQPYDVQNTTPTVQQNKFPTENAQSCVPSVMMGQLGYNWTALQNEVTAMQAGGSTNQTIGLVWGWQSLTQGAPLNAPTLPKDTQQVIILLSDGLNTQDRWYGDGSNQSSQVDGRMTTVCNNVKAAGITVYTVFVDLNGTQGNSTVLQNCATDISKYYDLTSSGQIISTFNAIAEQITDLRVLK